MEPEHFQKSQSILLKGQKNFKNFENCQIF